MILVRRRPVMASSTGALTQTVARPWRRAVPALLAAITLSAGGFVGAAATSASAAVVYPVKTNPAGSSVNLRSGPGTGYSLAGSVMDGTGVSLTCYAYGTSVTGFDGAVTSVWDKLSSGAWISDGFVNTGSAAPVVPACSTGTVPAAASGAVSYARAQLGDAYVLGANGPDAWDCSSLVQAAYRSQGVSLPRVTTDQYRLGRAVARTELKVGDLVFGYFNNGTSGAPDHVAIYAGNGQVIQAANPSLGVIQSALSDAYPGGTYYGARRIVG